MLLLSDNITRLGGASYMKNLLKNKKNIILLSFLIIILLYVMLQFVFIHRSIKIPDDIISSSTSLNIYEHIHYKKEQQELALNLPYEQLNTFFQTPDLSIETSNTNLSINDLYIDPQSQQLIGTITHPNKLKVNFSASFQLSIDNSRLIFDIGKIQLGTGTHFISEAVFRTQYGFASIHIPFQSTSKSILDDYLNTLISGQTLPLTETKTGFSYIFPERPIYDYQLYPISSELYTSEYPVHQIGDEEYIQLSQVQLIRDNLISSPLLSQLKSQGLEAKLLTNTSEDLILRIKSDEKQIIFDLNLVFILDVVDDGMLELKLDHIKTASENKVLITDKLFLESIQTIIDTYDTQMLKQYHIVSSSLNLTHVHLYFDQTSWTIMVYMIGSDLESSYDFYNNSLLGSASTDLEEMMQGHTSENIHVVVETGGTKSWKLDDIEPGVNQRWNINNEQMELIETLGRKNMSDQETLYDFTSWAVDTYPSDNYALILWNHGGGSLYGFGLDEYFPDDSLTLDELDNVLERVTHEQNMLFEVVGFDACLMATLETAAILEPYANYLIASEETEPDSGWDYERILSQLDDGEAYNGQKFGELVVSGFFDASVEENRDGLLTLSVIDLKFIPTVIQRMNKLFEAVVETNQFNLLSKTIPQVKAFGGNTELTGYTDHYDIENFAKRSLEFLPSESNRLLAAIDDAVIYKANGYLTTDAGGLSFYLPFYDLEQNQDLTDLYSPVAFSESYFSFVDQFVTYRLSSSVSSTMIPYTLYKESRPYRLQVTEGFDHLVSDIYLGVSAFETRNNEEYRLNLGYDAWIYEGFESGLYEESFGYWPAINNTYLPISVVYNGNDYIEYETPVLLNNEPIMLISAWLYDEERYVVFGGRPLIDTDGLADRNTIEFKDGDQIDILYSYYNKSTDQWIEEIATSITYDRASELILTNKPFEFNKEYGLSFIIKDLNGTLSYTDMIRFVHE